MTSSEHYLDGLQSGDCREVEDLHGKCGIYTRDSLVESVLDAVHWTATSDLRQAALLEPAAGDGAFVVAAATRLVRSFRAQGLEPKTEVLADRIRAWEIHPREAIAARTRVTEALRALGLHHRTASSCASRWITTGDFLLADQATNTFTHAVGNPPYVRWSKVPPNLRAQYERILPSGIASGDLMLAFLDRSLRSLLPGGHCGFVCSDRWMHMRFAEPFRQKWLPWLDIHSNEQVDARDAFDQSVDAYPSVVVASKRSTARQAPEISAKQNGITLADLGCTIRVGPALGCRSAFVLKAGESSVESQLLEPWVGSAELNEGAIAWQGRRVIAMHDEEGTLRVLNDYPRLASRLEKYRAQLEDRAIVRNGAPWYRPIDRIRAKDWERPKLLLPELARTPRVAIDRSGLIPSHGVYCIFVDDDDVERVYDQLKEGQLASALAQVSPRVKGGYLRCYKRFLLLARF